MKKTLALTILASAPVRARANALRPVAAAALFAMLAACGGGGGSDSSTSAASGASAPGTGSSGGSAALAAPVSLWTPGGAGAASFTPTGDMASDTLALFNARRAAAGLPAMAAQSDVAHAALNHALYNTGSNTVGHYELASVAGFTGVDPKARVNLYHASAAVGEVAAAIGGGPFASSYEAADGLFDAPFHRGVILADFAYAGVGVALAPDSLHFTNVIADFSDDTAFLAANRLVAWPYAGQLDAKTRWIANEDPNPLAATPQYVGQVVGYPVTLSASGASSFSTVSFSIADASGSNVPCQEVDDSNSPEAVRLAMCVPFAPLKPATAYAVKVSGTLTTNATGGLPAATRPFSVSWSFTTAPTDNVPPGTHPAAATGGATAKTMKPGSSAGAGEAPAPTLRFNAAAVAAGQAKPVLAALAPSKTGH